MCVKENGGFIFIPLLLFSILWRSISSVELDSKWLDWGDLQNDALQIGGRTIGVFLDTNALQRPCFTCFVLSHFEMALN